MLIVDTLSECQYHARPVEGETTAGGVVACVSSGAAGAGSPQCLSVPLPEPRPGRRLLQRLGCLLALTLGQCRTQCLGSVACSETGVSRSSVV